MKRFLILLLTAGVACGIPSTTFTEFYCNPSGSNLNGGSSTSTTAAYTCTNSNWDGTSVFTPTDGSTPASTVTAGDFASVYNDGASVAVYVARVTSVAAGANGAIILSTTAKSGTAPTSNATGRTIKVGGAWKGPNGTENFPVAFITAAQTDSNGNVPRVNFKNNAVYAITAAVTSSVAGPIRYQGYSSTPGDGASGNNKATISCSTVGASIGLLAMNASNQDWADFIFTNSTATSGASDGVTFGAAECTLIRIVCHDVRRNGFNVGQIGVLSECEAYACNQNASSGGHGGYNNSAAGSWFDRCIAHDNVASNAWGFTSSVGAIYTNCIADTNTKDGFQFSSTTTALIMQGCDSYNNSAAGLDVTSASGVSMVVENCNFIKNGSWGITSSGSSSRNGRISHCGFGAGTQVNTSGDINTNTGGAFISGCITYASNTAPWVDAANGDFRINLSTAKGAGKGTFTQTSSSYTGAIGYPDIGAAQHADAGGGGETSSASVR